MYMKIKFTKEKIGFALQIIVGGILIMTSFAELLMFENAVTMFTSIGLGSFIFLIGLVKLTFGVLIIIPKTKAIATLVISSYLGGAVAIHLSNQPISTIAFASVVLVATWVGAILNKKTFNQSFLFNN